MTNPYIRAAQKFPHIREQALERAGKRPEWAGRPGKPPGKDSERPRQSGRPVDEGRKRKNG
jgi:hypothetical protein